MRVNRGTRGSGVSARGQPRRVSTVGTGRMVRVRRWPRAGRCAARPSRRGGLWVIERKLTTWRVADFRGVFVQKLVGCPAGALSNTTRARRHVVGPRPRRGRATVRGAPRTVARPRRGRGPTTCLLARVVLESAPAGHPTSFWTKTPRKSATRHVVSFLSITQSPPRREGRAAHRPARGQRRTRTIRPVPTVETRRGCPRADTPEPRVPRLTRTGNLKTC